MAWNLRTDPITGAAGAVHNGIDLPFAADAPLIAMAPGRVVSVGNEPKGYGNFVDVMHEDGTLGRYAHANAIHAAVGDRIAQGDSLGLVGATGRATGPHIHFELRQGGAAVDPRAFVAQSRGMRAPAADNQTSGADNMATNQPPNPGNYAMPPNPDDFNSIMAKVRANQPSGAADPALVNAMTQNAQERSSILPLAMAAMISRDKGIAGFGGAMYEDANKARKLIPLGDEGFVDPQTGQYHLSPVGQVKRDEKMLELGIKQSEQNARASEANATRAQSAEMANLLRALGLQVAQQGADANSLRAKTAAEQAAQKDSDRQKIEAMIASDPNAPWKTPTDYERQVPGERARADKRLAAQTDAINALKQRQAKLDEFLALNATVSTGGPTSAGAGVPMIHSDKFNRMVQLANELQISGVPPGQGSVSNYERQLYGSAGVGPQYTRETNAAAAKAHSDLLNVQAERHAFLQDYYGKFGHMNGADKAASEYIDQKYGTAGTGGASGAWTGGGAPAAPSGGGAWSVRQK